MVKPSYSNFRIITAISLVSENLGVYGSLKLSVTGSLQNLFSYLRSKQSDSHAYAVEGLKLVVDIGN